MLIRLCCIVLLGLTLSWTEGSTARAGEKENPIVALAKKSVTDAEKPFTLVVILHVKYGAGKKFETAFAKARLATLKEKGCITYDLNRDSKDASGYVLYERWKSVAALDEHLKTDHIKTLLESLPELTTGAPELKILLPAGE